MTITKRKTTAILVCCAMLLAVLVPFGSVAKAATTFSPNPAYASAAGPSITVTVASPSTVTNPIYSGGGATISGPDASGDVYTVGIPANTSGTLTVVVDGVTTPSMEIKPVGSNIAVQGVSNNGITTITTGALSPSATTIGTGTFSVEIMGVPSSGTGKLYSNSTATTEITTYPRTISASSPCYYRPNSTSAMTDTFTFRLIDGNSVKSDTYTCTITVGGGTSTTVTASTYTVEYVMNGSAKVFFDTSRVTNSGSVMQYQFDAPVYTSFSASARGTISPSIDTSVHTASLPSLSYTPPTNDVGMIEIGYTVWNASSTPSTGKITIMVRPEARNDTYNTPVSTQLTVSDFSRGILGNDVYPNSTSSTYPTINIKSGPSYGTLNRNSNGTFTYMPNFNFTGTDTVTYTITYNNIESATATITFNVGSSGYWGSGNSRYATKANTTLNVPASSGLLSGLGSGYSVQRNSNSSTYFTVVNSDGSFSFVPPADQSGTFTLYYTLWNTANNTSTSESIGVDVVPVAESASYNVTAGTAFSISSTEAKSRNVGSNLRANLVSSPAHGTVTLNTDGTFTYTPTSGYTGTDTFSYTVTDTVANLTSPPATVTFNVASSGIVSDVPTTDSGDIGIAVTGESVWLSWMLYALGIMSLLIGGRAVYLAVRRMRATND